MYDEEAPQIPWKPQGTPEGPNEGTGEGTVSKPQYQAKPASGGKIIPPAATSDALQAAQLDDGLAAMMEQESAGKSYFFGASFHSGAREAHFARHPEACPEKEAERLHRPK